MRIIHVCREAVCRIECNTLSCIPLWHLRNPNNIAVAAYDMLTRFGRAERAAGCARQPGVSVALDVVTTDGRLGEPLDQPTRRRLADAGDRVGCGRPQAHAVSPHTSPEHQSSARCRRQRKHRQPTIATPHRHPDAATASRHRHPERRLTSTSGSNVQIP
jgi:hypothetical protein